MALKTKTPGGGGEKRRVHFVHLPTRNNQTWHAHVAGPCHWYTCHTKGRTKPCLHWLTDGELVCERCASTTPPEDIGYQPLFREVDGRPCFVVVHDYSREKIDQLRFHSRVIVGRGAEQSDGVYVIPALNARPLYETSREEFRREADLTETLLRVWGLPELIEWYHRTQRVPASSPVPPVAPAKKSAKPVDPMYVAAHERWTPDTVPESTSGEEAIQAAADRAALRAAQSPHANGKLPKKG